MADAKDKETYWSITTRGLYYKTSRMRNLRRIGRFHSKLRSFLLSVTNLQARENTLAYGGSCMLQICNVFKVKVKVKVKVKAPTIVSKIRQH
jgi:hypothetical protein